LKIAVISDTHGQIPESLPKALAGANLILHLGDLGPSYLLYELQTIAPVMAVQGNNDAPGQAELPPLRRFSKSGVNFHLRHIPWSPSDLRKGPRPSIFLHGHTHRPEIRLLETGYLLCPGALTMPRGGFPSSYAWIVFEEGHCRFTIRSISDRATIFEASWNLL
jgi:uncharacterized protein